MPNIRRPVPTDRLTLTADEPLIARLRGYAAATGQSCNKVMARAVARFLDAA